MTDEFLVIKNKYVATFVQKSIDLKLARQQQDVSKLRMLLHKLAGSSGGYGFDELSCFCQNALQLIEVKDDFNLNLLDGDLLQITAILDK